jgi:AbrB family looped-hinge helix DNA binding protein
MTTLTVSSKYQTVIPARMRESLGIRPGARLHAIEYRGRIALVPVQSMNSARGSLKDIDTVVPREPDRAVGCGSRARPSLSCVCGDSGV